MSEVKKRIQADLAQAMKAREETRTATLRMLLSAIIYEETSGEQHELSEAEFLAVVAREIKKRRESAEVYRSNNRDDLADQEEAEAEILGQYQPEQLTDKEVEQLVAEVVATECGDSYSMKDMGKVMRSAQEKAAGRVDGKRLSAAVKAALQA
ncbi:GatB/YqeY domain-containing protein [Corynebacterium poyangense]|uniref:GatB/YqeY domain-containing protein n=1 Tax=Corynebacterium poyangense TaxID=2684405 RepID=A0A7H0SLL6_9CORY|nr:GatB/YqeY domain-containing protein [Corynebacterium poyangense]MBZ8177540.1 GatB/YqeY domain-containing protein [Corynebacterium poyangense]QNQ89441.1 GatB/YqeY domain-containing protein [Corynebacterium poyangense]